MTPPLVPQVPHRHWGPRTHPVALCSVSVYIDIHTDAFVVDIQRLIPTHVSHDVLYVYIILMIYMEKTLENARDVT